MKLKPAALITLCALSTGAFAGEELKLPPEVTPSMRAACEADVRRLCVTPSSTAETVRQCVLEKFMRLGKRCQYEIASAGLAP